MPTSQHDGPEGGEGDAEGREGEKEETQEEGEEEENPLQRIIAPLISIFQLVIRSSYIATNIVMMVSFVFKEEDTSGVPIIKFIHLYVPSL